MTIDDKLDETIFIEYDFEIYNYFKLLIPEKKKDYTPDYLFMREKIQRINNGEKNE